jgi:hypothetical protein
VIRERGEQERERESKRERGGRAQRERGRAEMREQERPVQGSTTESRQEREGSGKTHATHKHNGSKRPTFPNLRLSSWASAVRTQPAREHLEKKPMVKVEAEKTEEEEVKKRAERKRVHGDG